MKIILVYSFQKKKSVSTRTEAFNDTFEKKKIKLVQ